MDFRAFVETLERQGRDEYVGYYRTEGGRKFEVWLRLHPDKSATITYIRGYPVGTGDFREVLPQFKADLEKLGVVKVDGSSAMDDKTGGKARERLFRRWQQ